MAEGVHNVSYRTRVLLTIRELCGWCAVAAVVEVPARAGCCGVYHGARAA